MMCGAISAVRIVGISSLVVIFRLDKTALCSSDVPVALCFHQRFSMRLDPSYEISMIHFYVKGFSGYRREVCDIIHLRAFQQ